MSTFGGLMFTNKGRNLQAKAQTGVQLKFTKIALGDGTLGSSAIADLTNLKNIVVNLPIERLRTLSGGRAEVAGILSNQSLTSGFYYRELGLFALDPQEGEILYCYGNAGNLAEYIPASGGPDVVEKQIVIQTVVGNAANITAVIDTSLVYATVSDMHLAIEQNLLASKNYTDNEINIIDQQIAELENQLGALTNLETEQKANLVAAINELKGSIATHLVDKTDPHNSKQQAIDWAKGFGLGSEAKVISDLNTINAETGFYLSKTNALNTPTGVGIPGTVLQIARNSDSVSQLFVDINNSKLYSRTRNGSSWGTWKLVIDESMKNIPGGIVGLDNKGQIPSNTIPSDNEFKIRSLGLF